MEFFVNLLAWLGAAVLVIGPIALFIRIYERVDALRVDLKSLRWELDQLRGKPK